MGRVLLLPRHGHLRGDGSRLRDLAASGSHGENAPHLAKLLQFDHWGTLPVWRSRDAPAELVDAC